MEISENLLSEKEFAERLLESSLLFADILPIYMEEQRAAFRLAFDQDLTDIIPEFFHDLARFCIKNREDALPYIKFIHQSTGYILGISDKQADIDYPMDEIKKKVQHQLSGWKLSDELQPYVVVEKKNEKNI